MTRSGKEEVGRMVFVFDNESFFFLFPCNIKMKSYLACYQDRKSRTMLWSNQDSDPSLPRLIKVQPLSDLLDLDPPKS